jgi:chitodextrinase
MQTWISPSTTLTYPTDWYTVVDKYYLQKTGNVRYFANLITPNYFAIATLVTAAVDGTAPVAPTGLAASLITQSSFSLTWTPSADLGVYCYLIYKDNILLATTANAYLDVTDLAVNTTYSMTIKAKDVAGNTSVLSTALPVQTLSSDTEKPTIPTGLSSSKITVGGFTLNWSGASTDNVGVTGYEAYNGTTLLGSSTGTGTTMVISGLTQGTIYNVTLKAIDAGGNFSDPSAPLTVITISEGLIVNEPFDYTTALLNPDPDGGANASNGYPATGFQFASTGLRNSWGNNSIVSSNGLNYSDATGNTLNTSGKA